MPMSSDPSEDRNETQPLNAGAPERDERPEAPHGSGDARTPGYGAGGLGSGALRAQGTPDPRDAPGVAPDGRRNSASSSGELSEIAAGEPPPGRSLKPPQVASGDRRDAHYEADEGQVVRARFTTKPAGGLPPRQAMGASDRVEATVRDADKPVEDIAVADDGESVWDARPSD
jgi:hypothetical protein